MTDENETWRRFARVYAEFLSSRSWHEDLAGFYRRRFDVYSRLLGVDLEDSSSFDRQRQHLYDLGFRGVATRYGSLVSPFDGILYAKPPLIDVVRSFAPRFTELLDRERQLYVDVMVQTALHLWGPLPRAVTDADLVAYRVAEQHEPDPGAYL